MGKFSQIGTCSINLKRGADECRGIRKWGIRGPRRKLGAADLHDLQLGIRRKNHNLWQLGGHRRIYDIDTTSKNA